MNLQKGLIGHWKLDGNAKDSTPYCNHGTIDGAVATTDRHGKVAGALLFDGIDDAINVGRPTVLEQDFNQLTLSAWVNLDTIQKSHGFVGKSTIWYLAVNATTGTPFLRHVNWATGITVGTTALQPGRWHHVVGTFNGSNASVYLDGNLDGELNAAAGSLGTNTTGIGIGNLSFPGHATFWADGSLDDVRIYNRALSAAEVKALYDSYQPQIKFLDKGLVAHYTLDGHAKDRTPYNNHGTISGAVATTDRHGKVAGALDFDGTDDYVNLGDILDDVWTGGDWSVSFFMNRNGKSTFPAITKAGDSTVSPNENQRQFILALIDAGGGDLRVRCNLFTQLDITELRVWRGGTTIQDNTWYHVTYVYDADASSDDRMDIFLNGSAETLTIPFTAGTLSTIKNGTARLSFGSVLGSSGATPINFSGGLLDDVRIYNRALSATEIKSLYDSYNPMIKL